jgi:hypothetical protein
MPSALARYLEDDHARLAALLRAAIADERRFDTASFEEFRAGLLRHIGIEEKLLLPAARRRRGAPIADAATLRLEHSALASLMVPTPDRALVAEITRLLEWHNAREEGDDGVYAQCTALATDEEQSLLEQSRATPPPPLAKHFDGAGVHRTADEALRAAESHHARRKQAHD